MAQIPRRTVLLRHHLPDGSHHFDWMLEVNEDGPLLTFRLDRDISQDDAPFEAERLADHRRRYLIYEGPISGDRGSVARVAEGQCEVGRHANGAYVVSLILGNRHQTVRGIPQQDGWYAFGI